MKIVNPLYDYAFKYLMDNEQIAKKVLSIILNTKILQLHSKPQETTISESFLIEPDKNVKVTTIKMVRYDFKAIILTEEGEEQAALIELQKYDTPDPIVRFRQYLASNYLKEDTFIDAHGNEQVRPLPIITIYILGFNLKGFETPAFKVLNQPFDLINNKIINVKSDFVNLLTHPSIILQAAYEGKGRGTMLERFLKIFHQKMRGEKSDYVIELDEGEEFEGDLKEIVDYLHRALANEELLRQLQLEDSTTKGIKDLKGNLEEALKREEEERLQKEAALAKEKEALAKEKEERRQKEEALAKEKGTRIFSAKTLLEYNVPIEKIMQTTGLSHEEIQEIKKKLL